MTDEQLAAILADVPGDFEDCPCAMCRAGRHCRAIVAEVEKCHKALDEIMQIAPPETIETARLIAREALKGKP